MAFWCRYETAKCGVISLIQNWKRLFGLEKVPCITNARQCWLTTRAPCVLYRWVIAALLSSLGRWPIPRQIHSPGTWLHPSWPHSPHWRSPLPLPLPLPPPEEVSRHSWQPSCSDSCAGKFSDAFDWLNKHNRNLLKTLTTGVYPPIRPCPH